MNKPERYPENMIYNGHQLIYNLNKLKYDCKIVPNDPMVRYRQAFDPAITPVTLFSFYKYQSKQSFMFWRCVGERV
jgi:hypothetical protein